MLKLRVPSVVFGVIALAAPSFAQDSVSKTPCLPGDAVRPWDDNTAITGSEQRNDYIVDLAPLTTSWGKSFGIAPIIKSSKTSSGFFTSQVSAQGISRRQKPAQPPTASVYRQWNGAGFGVNNDPAINDPGTPVSSAGVFGNQFGVGFAEFATTDQGASYNAIIGGLVNIAHDNPARLYVSRVVAATNGCSDAANVSQLAFGSVDEDGNMVLRADNFGVPLANGICGPTVTSLTGNNIFMVNIADRDGNVQNVMSSDFPGGMFDAPATTWIVQNSATTYNTPGIVPASVTGSVPLYIGGNFNTQYARGSSSPVTEDGTHIAGTGLSDQRGNIAYTTHNIPAIGGTAGTAAFLGQNIGICSSGACTDSLLLWGLDPNGDVAGGGTAKLVLALPQNPNVIQDNDPTDGFTNLVDVAAPIVFNNYQSQVAFRGGNGAVGMNIDPAGNLLVAAEVDHPTQITRERNWDLNIIAVARINPTTGVVDWTMAGYTTSDLSGGALGGKAIKDGPGGATIGFMRPRVGDFLNGGNGDGPVVSTPTIDAAGNVWFLSVVEMNDNPGVFTTALLRAVYDVTAFKYELELVLKLGDVFPGQNSSRNWTISFIAINDSNSISSGSMYSQNASEIAHLGMDPSGLMRGDPRGLGGLVMAAEIVYDVDQNGLFDQCDFVPTSADQDYNVLLYIGATDPVPCSAVADCDDKNVCTLDACVPDTGGDCVYTPHGFGDINGVAPVNIFDLFCILDGLANDFSTCSKSNIDITTDLGDPCTPNGVINVFDLFALLDALGGLDPCCVPATGGCCIAGACQPDLTEADCLLAGGLYQGDGSDCAAVTCPPVGACCVLGNCVPDQTEVACELVGGIYRGNGSDCATATCPQVGACCTAGVCADDVTQADCIFGGGLYQGDSSTCATTTCPTGACCAAGFCTDGARQIDCEAGGGTYQGNNSACTDVGVDCGTPISGVTINEIRTDQIGPDNDEYFELAGAPGTSLTGLTYLVIGDGISGSGNIEAVVPLTGQSIPADGFFLAAEGTLTLATPDLTLDGATNELNFENSDNVTHMLVAGFIGQLNDDVDVDDNCVMDNMPWAAVLDQIALVEVDPPVAGVDDCLYGTAKLGPDGTFVPGHEFRCPDGTGAWLIGIFDPPGLDDTPGMANTCLPRPANSTGQQSDVRASRQVSPQEARERSRSDD